MASPVIDGVRVISQELAKRVVDSLDDGINRIDSSVFCLDRVAGEKIKHQQAFPFIIERSIGQFLVSLLAIGQRGFDVALAVPVKIHHMLPTPRKFGWNAVSVS